MELVRVSIMYLMSICAAKVLKFMIPLEFEEVDCDNDYTTRVDQAEMTYVVTVNQWKIKTKTRWWFFNNVSYYYKTESLVLCNGSVIMNIQGFSPERNLGLFKPTKLQHAIIALAELDKIRGILQKANAA